MSNKFLMKYLPLVHRDGRVHWRNLVVFELLATVWIMGGLYVLWRMFGGPSPGDLLVAALVAIAMLGPLGIAQCRNVVLSRRLGANH